MQENVEVTLLCCYLLFISHPIVSTIVEESNCYKSILCTVFLAFNVSSCFLIAKIFNLQIFVSLPHAYLELMFVFIVFCILI